MKAIVSDATSLIVLAKLERLEILNWFFDTVIIPSTVMAEILAKDDHTRDVWQQPWIEQVDGTVLELCKELLQILDAGESEALALADTRRLPLLIDEKKGRSIARRRKIPVVGVVGILARAVQRAFLDATEAEALLDRAQEAGFRVSDRLKAEFLKLIG